MKKITMLIVLALLCLNFYSRAQDNHPSAELKPGDQIPDVHLANLLNYPANTVSLSAFRGKLLVLDFWATWCSSCLVYFSRTEKLQKQFQDQIQILAVTDQSRSEIERFFKSQAGKRFNFPTVVGDTQLKKLFPHRYLPHYVWITQDGTFLTSTSGAALDSATITRFLNQKTLPGKVKNDLDTRLPLFITDKYPTDNQIQFYSILSKGHYYGLSTGSKFRRKNSILYGRAVTNSSLYNIYKIAAYGLFERAGEAFSDKRIILDVQNVTALKGDSSKRPDHPYDYNFDLMVPMDQADSLFFHMLKTLNQYSAYNGHIETRDLDCLALVSTDKAERFATKGGALSSLQPERNSSKVINTFIPNFLVQLNSITGIEKFIIDETGYAGNVDIQFKGPVQSLEKLLANLRPYGLDIVPVKRKLKVFILQDKHAPDVTVGQTP